MPQREGNTAENYGPERAKSGCDGQVRQKIVDESKENPDSGAKSHAYDPVRIFQDRLAEDCPDQPKQNEPGHLGENQYNQGWRTVGVEENKDQAGYQGGYEASPIAEENTGDEEAEAE